MNLPDSILIDLAAGTAEGALHVDPGAEYLQDHFPGAPMLPGLLMLEVGVRVAAALWSATQPPVGGAVLEHLERLQVVRRVLPGETLRVVAARAGDGEVEPARAWFAVRGTVGAEMAVRAKFRLRAIDAGHRQWEGQHA